MPTTRDVVLGFLLHILLGELLGVGSIFPFALPIAIFDGAAATPLLDAYAFEVVIFCLLIPYLCRRDISGAAALWLNRIDPGRVAALAAGAFLVSYLGGFLIDAVLGVADWTPDDDIRQDFDSQGDSPIGYFLYAMVPVTIAPVVEELVFRGLLFTHIRSKLGPVPTIAISGALFGLLHGGPPSYAASIVLSGIVFGLLRERTGGVTVPIAAHLLNNAIATLSIL